LPAKPPPSGASPSIFEADGPPELRFAHGRETISRIDLASDSEKELRKRFGRSRAHAIAIVDEKFSASRTVTI
jgi:hypothetical protein